MKLRIFLFCCLISMASLVHAEGRCPPGYFEIGGPDVLGCAPMTGPQRDDEPVENNDGPEWQPRWGAIAIGGGGWGAVRDMPSERQAKKAATKQCKKTANGDAAKCSKAFSYYNQCAVIAWGATGYVLQGAIDLPTASSIGMKKCSKDHAECEIFYSGCSYPKRIR